MRSKDGSYKDGEGIVRLIDGDELYATVEEHVTTVSACATAEQARGETSFKSRCLNDIDTAPTIRAMPIDWINAQIGRMKVKGSPWVAMAIESLIKAWEQENKHGESEIPSDTRL